MLLKEILYSITEDFKTQAKKFVEAGADKNEVDKYIAVFRKIRDIKKKEWVEADIDYKAPNGRKILIGPKGHDRFDIDKYSNFEELKAFVKYVSTQYPLEKGKFDDIKVNGEPVAKGHGLEIYHGDSRKACVEYKGDKPYSWCISRADSENRYDAYRYMQHEPSFYFVKDVEAMKVEFEKEHEGSEFHDPWHFFVVQVTDIPSRKYYVTNANNNPGQEEMTWEKLLKIKPALKYFENILAHHRVSDREKEIRQKYHKKFTDKEFEDLSYEEKEIYLDVGVIDFGLSDYQFGYLPKPLKNKYIGFGIPLSSDMYVQIKNDKDLLKRFVQICFQKLKKKNEDRSFEISEIELKAILRYPNAKEELRNVNDWFMFECFRHRAASHTFKFEEFEKVIGKEKIVEWISSNKPERADDIISIIHAWSNNKETVIQYSNVFKKSYPDRMLHFNTFFRPSLEDWSNSYSSTFDLIKATNNGKVHILNIRSAIQRFHDLYYQRKSAGIKELFNKIMELLNEDALDISHEPSQFKNKEFLRAWIVYMMIPIILDMKFISDSIGSDVLKRILLTNDDNLFFLFDRRSNIEDIDYFNKLYQTASYIISMIGYQSFFNKNGANVIYLLLIADPEGFDQISKLFGDFLHGFANSGQYRARDIVMGSLGNSKSPTAFVYLTNLFKSKDTGNVFDDVNITDAVSYLIPKLATFVGNGWTVRHASLVEMLKSLGSNFAKNMSPNKIDILLNSMKEAEKYGNVDRTKKPWKNRDRDEFAEYMEKVNRRNYEAALRGTVDYDVMRESSRGKKKPEAYTKYRNYFI